MRCNYCGGEASDYEPEVREVVDYVPYGERNVPMVSYEGSEAAYLCDDCGRELCDDEVFEGTDPVDLEEYFGIDPVEERKLELYMDIVNRMLAGTFEAIGYMQKSVESWQRREMRLKNIKRPKRQ
jgi:hypothetical protein